MTQAMYGIVPPVHLPYVAGDSSNDVVDRLCLLRELTMQLLKDHLHKAQHRMPQQANRHQTEREFAISKLVYLKLHPFQKNLLNNSALHKLAARYFGPFLVIKRISKVAYDLQLPANTRMHPVFHVSLLKKSVGPGIAVSSSLPLVDADGQFQLEPLQILGRRVTKSGNLPLTQILVQWKHTRKEDATWEDLSFVQQQFPTFSMDTPPAHSILVDKDFFFGGEYLLHGKRINKSVRLL